ncbi:quinone oxidoreductase family protein [Microbacterium sp. AGC85]
MRIHTHGGPEVLRFGEYPLAPLGPTDVLVEIDTASVSGWDIKYRAGKLSGVRLPGRSAPPLPQQLGREGAGVVAAVGLAVAGFVPGDRVVAVVHPANPQSPETIRGLGNLSTGIDVPGHASLGSYAKYVVRNQSLWLHLQEHVDLEQAAVSLWPYGTSHRLVRDRLRLRLGDSLLVCGASGGMGEATIALAKLTGARVVATTRHDAKIEGLHSIGADEVVVTDDRDAALARVREWTGGEGVSHAVDYTGNAELMRLAVDALRLGGVFCPASGTQIPPGPPPFTVNDFTRLELTMIGVRGARHEDALAVLDLLAQGRISPRIAARFPLSEAASAHRLYEESRDLVGRIVLKP